VAAGKGGEGRSGKKSGLGLAPASPTGGERRRGTKRYQVEFPRVSFILPLMNLSIHTKNNQSEHGDKSHTWRDQEVIDSADLYGDPNPGGS
jgi:hypothetical protein